jgi:hypothetical protein
LASSELPLKREAPLSNRSSWNFRAIQRLFICMLVVGSGSVVKVILNILISLNMNSRNNTNLWWIWANSNMPLFRELASWIHGQNTEDNAYEW